MFVSFLVPKNESGNRGEDENQIPRDWENPFWWREEWEEKVVVPSHSVASEISADESDIDDYERNDDVICFEFHWAKVTGIS